MTDDQQLLRQYTENNSETAFAELVARHIDLVYSVALRFVNGDAHLSQDITQTVFVDLARKAWNLPRGVVLAGWLHRHTCFTAATAIRAERRRKTREQTAAEMSALDHNTGPEWETIAPHLDGALNQLSASDRDAIVLRFLKRMDFRAVGTTLGISEDAAQKRVSRALEKLRAAPGLRGVSLSVIALTSLLAARTATAAPAGLAGGVSAAALTAAKTPGTALTILKLMATTKAKLGVLSVLMVAGVTAPLFIQHQAQAALRVQAETSRKRAGEIAQVQDENTRLSNSLSRSETSPTIPGNQSNEVLRLRGEIGRLQAAVREISEAKTNGLLSRDDVLASMRQMYAERVARLKQYFADNPSQAVPEMRYLTDLHWLNFVDYDYHRMDPGNSNTLSNVRSGSQIEFSSRVLWPALRKYAKSNGGQFPADVSDLVPFFDPPVEDSVLEDWTVLPSNRLPASLQIGEPWVITQKGPVNRDLDSRFVIGVKSTRIGNHGDAPWDAPPDPP